MKILVHPIVPCWLQIMKAANLRAIHVCTVAGVSKESFSRWKSGTSWPTKPTAMKINRAIGALSGVGEEKVHKLVGNLWVTGGKVTGEIFKQDLPQFIQPVIPIVVHKQKRRKIKGK